jgi:LPS O-antigen subunit length determinant protein (WzzB/FepE family)
MGKKNTGIFDFLYQGWKYILGLLAAGGFMAAAWVYVTPPQYEALAIVKLGRITHVGDQSARLVEVESKRELIERLKSPAFYTKETVAACKWDFNGPSNTAITDIVRLQPFRDEGEESLISIAVRQGSLVQAKDCLLSIISLVKIHQDSLMESTIDNFSTAITALEKKLSSEREISDYYKKTGNTAAFYMNLSEIDRTVERLDDLRMRRDRLQPMETLYSPQSEVRPVSPRPLRTILLGALLGAALGGFIVLIRRTPA